MPSVPLNVFQRLIRNWERAHPYNAAQVLQLRGRADPAAVDAAWTDAVAALGLGCVRVEGDRFQFQCLNGARQRYGVQVLPQGACLAEHLSRGLNLPFDDPEEPPLRPFLLQEGDAYRFGVVYQHWVADSVSIRLLLREWFARAVDPAAAGAAAAGAAGGRAVRLARDGYWKLFGGRLRVDATALDLFRSHMRFRRVRKVRVPSRQDFAVRVLVPDESAGVSAGPLRDAARRRGAKLTDLLLAALADACNRHLPLQPRPNRPDLAVGTIIDLRPHARGGLEGQFGLFLGFTYNFCRRSDLRDWPRLVRSVALQNRAVAQAGAAPASAGWMLAALCVQRFVPPKGIYHFYRKEMPLTAGLSNVNLNGTWPERFHPSPLEGYLRISPTGPMCPLVLSATTLGDRLRFALTYRQSVVDPATAENVMDAVFARLREEAGE